MIAINFNYELKNTNSNSLRVEPPPLAIVSKGDVEEFSLPSVFNTPTEAEILLDNSTKQRTDQNKSTIGEIGEWTQKLEVRFRRLAEDKALNQLSIKAMVEFEKLMALRRQLKNPRTGEEVLREYKQRMVTRNLVNALTQYVEFHQLPNSKG